MDQEFDCGSLLGGAAKAIRPARPSLLRIESLEEFDKDIGVDRVERCDEVLKLFDLVRLPQYEAFEDGGARSVHHNQCGGAIHCH
jgi:hypothetical protein